jgi:anti-sigma-K factor RskA
MMAYSEDDIARAIEYAFGTLDAEERAQVEAKMSVEKDFTAMVRAWEYKLGVLNEMVGPVEPSPELWDRIKSVTGVSQPQEPVLLPELARPAPEIPPEPLAATAAGRDDTTASVIRLSAQVRRWRGVASFTTAMAAALVAMIALGAYQPDLLPSAIRPKPRTQVTEVKPSLAPAQPPAQAPQYVAVLQKDAGSPAFILTVDGATKNFVVRRVAAQPEPGRSYELWIVSDKLQRPRSLGVIGADDFTARPVLAAYAPDIVDEATYAVTIEPEGGSPTGVATGPIVFTGKLVETVPPAASGSSRPR